MDNTRHSGQSFHCNGVCVCIGKMSKHPAKTCKTEEENCSFNNERTFQYFLNNSAVKIFCLICQESAGVTADLSASNVCGC